ncbi:hypothetical protein Tsp_01780 [Trichinella spiralis]|uniref:hypothetical protein n=1 Tax=Trichinella spiralis TaxID=6334 RepID=UPI0001EFCC94|nr:hypothetical protein Tsp_01780 [Trichinella spiralis]
MHVRLHDFQLHKRSDQYVDVEQHALRLYYDIFMRQRESNPMSSARQAVWLTTVLHAAQRCRAAQSTSTKSVATVMTSQPPSQRNNLKFINMSVTNRRFVVGVIRPDPKIQISTSSEKTIWGIIERTVASYAAAYRCSKYSPSVRAFQAFVHLLDKAVYVTVLKSVFHSKELNSTSAKERCPLTRHSAADSALVEASLLDTILGIEPYFSCITSCITLSIRSIAAVEQRALGQQGSDPISPVRYWQLLLIILY